MEKVWPADNTDISKYAIPTESVLTAQPSPRPQDLSPYVIFSPRSTGFSSSATVSSHHDALFVRNSAANAQDLSSILGHMFPSHKARLSAPVILPPKERGRWQPLSPSFTTAAAVPEEGCEPYKVKGNTKRAPEPSHLQHLHFWDRGWRRTMAELYLQISPEQTREKMHFFFLMFSYHRWG